MLHRTVRRLGATTALALVAGLAAVSPASAAVAQCGPAPASNNNSDVNAAPVAVDDTASASAGRSVEIPVLDNDTDPDGDVLALVSAGRPTRGSACTTVDGTILYTPEVVEKGYTTTFRYGMTDGDRYRSAEVTVEVTGLARVRAKVERKLVVKRGKVTRRAKVALTNSNDVALDVIVGGRRTFSERVIRPGKTIVVTTRERQLQFLAFTYDETTDTGSIVSVGTVATRTGRVRTEFVGESESFGWAARHPGRAVARLVR